MKKQKISGKGKVYLISSNNNEDDNCPVCLLMKECEKNQREPTTQELEIAFLETSKKQKGGS